MPLLFYPALAGLQRCAQVLKSLHISAITVTATSTRHKAKSGQPKESPSLVGKSPLAGLWRFLLTLPGVLAYGLPVAPQWVAGRENPYRSKATPDALSVFFIVAISAHLYSAAHGRTVSMVALVGQLSGWPVPFDAGILTPISVTTLCERENSGGDSLNQSKEATIMVATPTQTQPTFCYRFLALSRADRSAKPCRLSIEAHTEHEARRILAQHYILSFAARLPVQGVRHV